MASELKINNNNIIKDKDEQLMDKLIELGDPALVTAQVYNNKIIDFPIL